MAITTEWRLIVGDPRADAQQMAHQSDDRAEERGGESGAEEGDQRRQASADLLPWQAANVLRIKREQMQTEHKCVNCFLFKTYCICASINGLFERVREEKHFLTHLHLFMHFKEWGRSSNTGKLMQLGLGDQCTTSLLGVVEEEQLLEQRLLSEPSVILYPRADSVPVSSLRDWYRGHGGKVNVVVIDSTWPQSHAMDKRLPQSVRRVKIDEMVEGPSQFLNRKQSKTKTKVSTIEATVMALRGLGVEESVLSTFESSLRFGVDAVLRQGGKAAVYGHVLLPQDVSAGNYTQPSVSKPTSCPRCLKTREDGVNFRNAGVRKRLDEGSFRVWRCTGCDDFFHVPCGDAPELC